MFLIGWPRRLIEFRWNKFVPAHFQRYSKFLLHITGLNIVDNEMEILIDRWYSMYKKYYQSVNWSHLVVEKSLKYYSKFIAGKPLQYTYCWWTGFFFNKFFLTLIREYNLSLLNITKNSNYKTSQVNSCNILYLNFIQRNTFVSN